MRMEHTAENSPGELCIDPATMPVPIAENSPVKIRVTELGIRNERTGMGRTRLGGYMRSDHAIDTEKSRWIKFDPHRDQSGAQEPNRFWFAYNQYNLLAW
jgi:hypothetical protein